MIKRFFIILALLFSFGLAAEEMPQVAFYSEYPDIPPHWVAAEAALDDAGKPRLDLFESGLIHESVLTSYGQQVPGSCPLQREPLRKRHQFL